MPVFVLLCFIETIELIAENSTCKGIEKYLIAQYNQYNYFTAKSLIWCTCKTRIEEIKNNENIKI
jgi:hypothetical protein